MSQEIQDERAWINAIANKHLIGRNYSQVHRILVELTQHPDSRALEDEIDDLLFEIRAVFHYRREATAQVPALNFTEEPEEFVEKIKDASEKEKAELMHAYGVVWLHQDVGVDLTGGKRNSILNRYCLQAPVEQIEQIAERYLSHPSLRSNMLEWIIVNSLLYAETHAYAESVTTLPQAWIGVGSEKGPSWWKAEIFNLGWWSLELVKWVITGVLAMYVGGADRAAAVILFAAITGARWFRIYKKKEPKRKEVRLAIEMSQAHVAAKKLSFNSGLVRHIAYTATVKGAVFNDYVYAILDRRVRHA